MLLDLFILFFAFVVVSLLCYWCFAKFNILRITFSITDFFHFIAKNRKKTLNPKFWRMKSKFSQKFHCFKLFLNTIIFIHASSSTPSYFFRERFLEEFFGGANIINFWFNGRINRKRLRFFFSFFIHNIKRLKISKIIMWFMFFLDSFSIFLLFGTKFWGFA